MGLKGLKQHLLRMQTSHVLLAIWTCKKYWIFLNLKWSWRIQKSQHTLWHVGHACFWFLLFITHQIMHHFLHIRGFFDYRSYMLKFSWNRYRFNHCSIIWAGNEVEKCITFSMDSLQKVLLIQHFCLCLFLISPFLQCLSQSIVFL